MNSPSQATEAPAAPAPTPSLDERIAEVNASLDDGSSAPTGDSGGSTSPAEPPGSPVDSGDPATKQRAQERRVRLAAMAAQERHNVDRKASLAAQDKLARDYEAATKRALEAEALAARRVDVDNLDEAAFFRLAEQKNIQPQRLGEWIRNAMTNPERVAEAAALSATRSTYDPKLAALEAQIAELRAQNQSFLDRHNEAQAAVQEREQTHAFLGMVSQSADRAPLAARLLAADQNEFMQIAELAARNVPGQGPQALLDAVEEMLDQDGRQVAQTYAALYGFTSQAQAPKTQNRAAAMANTVSNSLAQERASLVEEEDYARLPIEERAARLIRSMK